MKKGMEILFDYTLYPAALLYLGFVWGGLIMTISAIVLNVVTIKVYDWSKTDWLLIETLKSARDNPDVQLPGILGRLQFLLHYGDVAAFFVISMFDDPVDTVLYLRKGSHEYNGLSSRDWWIFVGANLLANISWILQLSIVIASIKALFLDW